MKTSLLGLAMFGFLLCAGCSSAPSRSSAGFVGEALRNPARYYGQWVSSFGSVLSVSPDGNTTVFRVATPNYAYVFEVSYSGEVPGLAQGRDVSFLGTIVGAVDSRYVYGGRVLRLEGVAVRPAGGRPVYRPDQAETARAWSEGKFDASGGGAPAPHPSTPAIAAAPTLPAPAIAPAEEVDGSAFKVFVKKWNASAPATKARAREFMDRWSGTPDGAKALFFEWNGLSAEDKALFRELVAQSPSP